MNQKTDAFYTDDKSKPYTHLNFKNDPDEFQFAIITDNAGGAREGVFPYAVEMANLLHPEFIVHAGDLIEGYDDDEEQIRAWWQEVDESLEPLEMPFFFLPGNHDHYSAASLNVWNERFGADRGYYHFRYKRCALPNGQHRGSAKDSGGFTAQLAGAIRTCRRELPGDGGAAGQGT